MKVVILAGGLGTRLRPFTDVIPKPLLPLGEKSLMEIQIESLKKCGATDIYIALNYKADYVRAFLGDGSRFGIRIHYSLESIPLGTAGPVKLLERELTSPFMLINGDILTKLNFSEMYDFACAHENSIMTVGTKFIVTPFRFGKIHAKDEYITSIEEKPQLEFEILAGIYVLKPAVFDFIPKDQYFGIDQLIRTLVSNRLPVTKFLINDYWLDIGVAEDYSSACKEVSENF